MNAYNKYLTIHILFFTTFISINGYDNYAHNNYKSTPHIIHQTRAPEANNSQWRVSFSCNNNPFPHNRSWNNPQYHKSEDPRYYTAKDFSNYFSQGYSEKEILVEHRHLYLYDEFVTFAKTLPGYQETIVKLHHELKDLSRTKKFLYILNGAYWPGLDKRIKKLFEEIKKNPQRPITTSSYTIPMGYCAISAFQDALPSYNILRPLYNDYNPYLSQAIDNRTRAYDTAVKNKMAVKTVAYDIDDNMQKLLQKYEHAVIPLTSCTGDDLMQCLHQESLDILEQVTYLPYNSILLDHREALVDITVAMNEYNHEKKTTTAFNIADFCWTLLDYGKAVGEGIAQGVCSAVTGIINNPVETALNLVIGQELLAYQLCKVAYNVTDIGITAMYDYNGATKKWDTYIAPINNLIETFKKGEIAGRDIVKGTTAFLVQGYAKNKLLGGLGKFCSTIKKKGIDAAKNKIFKNPQTYASTPEGMLCKATSEFNKNDPAKPANLKSSVDKKITKTTNTTKKTSGPKKSKTPPVQNEIIRYIKNDLKSKIREYEEHIFSKDHIKGNIYTLGKDRETIMDSIHDVIMSVNRKGLLREGPNLIKTSINGVKNVEIRCFIQNSEVSSITTFISNFNKIYGNFIDATQV